MKQAYDNVGIGGRKKQMLLCNGADTGTKEIIPFFLLTGHESEQTSDWFLIARKFIELTKGGTQMTVMATPMVKPNFSMKNSFLRRVIHRHSFNFLMAKSAW